MVHEAAAAGAECLCVRRLVQNICVCSDWCGSFVCEAARAEHLCEAAVGEHLCVNRLLADIVTHSPMVPGI